MAQSRIKDQAAIPLTHTLRHETQSRQLAGKTIVVVGAGEYGLCKMWTEAGELGVKLVLVDSNPHHPARHVADTFLHVDMTDHTQDAQHANTIVRLLRQRLPEGKVDGCLSMCDDSVPLAARVGQALGLSHAISVEAAMNAKSKERTHAVLSQEAMETPHDQSPADYASPVVKVNTVEEVTEALKKIPLPVVMKLEFGHCAVGAKHVYSIEEAEKHMELMLKSLRNELDLPEIGLGYGKSMILTPRLLGTEHIVDLALYEDQIVRVSIMDTGPTRLPFCEMTANMTPSLLPKKQRQQLIQAAASCCRGIGLHTGVFCIEMILTCDGPRLLEINARMNGHFARDWIRLIYNVDPFHLAMMCACGIRPVLPGSSGLEEDQKDSSKDQALGMKKEEDVDSSNGYILGIQLYPSRHAQALATTASFQQLQLLHEEGQVIFYQLEAEVATNGGPFEKAVGNLAVRASCPHEARTKLVSVCTKLGLETEESLLQVLPSFVQPSK